MSNNLEDRKTPLDFVRENERERLFQVNAEGLRGPIEKALLKAFLQESGLNELPFDLEKIHLSNVVIIEDKKTGEVQMTFKVLGSGRVRLGGGHA